MVAHPFAGATNGIIAGVDGTAARRAIIRKVFTGSAAGETTIASLGMGGTGGILTRITVFTLAVDGSTARIRGIRFFTCATNSPRIAGFAAGIPVTFRATIANGVTTGSPVTGDVGAVGGTRLTRAVVHIGVGSTRHFYATVTARAPSITRITITLGVGGGASIIPCPIAGIAATTGAHMVLHKLIGGTGER